MIRRGELSGRGSPGAGLSRIPSALSVTWVYPWVTAVWLVLIAASAATLSYRFLTGVTKPQASSREAARERDEAEAVVAAFGRADEDRVDGVDPPDLPRATRVMIFVQRQVRVTFLLRVRGTPSRPLWKLAGFTEPDGRTALSGEEALRRLLRQR